jgi:DNA-binding transcriptional MerR regulator
VKALRLYEQHGLITPSRTAAGWRVYGPDEMAKAADIVTLRAFGLSLSQIARVLADDPQGLEPALAAHQATLEDRIRQLAGTVGKVRGIRAGLAQGKSPTAKAFSSEVATGSRVENASTKEIEPPFRFNRNGGSAELARLLRPTTGFSVAFDLPWPWGGERFELSDVRSLNYIIGPLGSGKTRLAMRLAETLPDAVFLGLDRLQHGGAAARAQMDANPAFKSRIDQSLAWLVEDGAAASEALVALLVGLESEGAAVVVVDMVEQGLDQAAQQALIAHLRRRGPGARPLFLLTRSSAILDLAAVGAEEAIIFCPANHSPPTSVAPYPGAPGYEAVATCLASPEVRARTEGVIAWRPQVA